MGYADNNLLPGEQVVYKAKIHWFIFIKALVPFFLCFFIGLSGKSITGIDFLSGFGLALTLFLLARALIYRVSTELALTSKRIIVKMGLIRLKIDEISRVKIENLSVNQGFFGRLFRYGTFIISSADRPKILVRNIASPLQVRRIAMRIISDRQAQHEQ